MPDRGPELIALLAAEFPASRFSLRDVDRWAYGRDLSTQSLIRVRVGAELDRPAAVVWPEDESEIATLVHLARQHRLALVPFGAGSGVVGGIAGGARAVMVDLKRLDAIELDAKRRICSAGAGVIGEQLERWLNERGWSLGHFPSSIYCSTVGGWVATRSAGQLSSRYGKIEDMVVWIEGVDGTGRFHRIGRDAADVDALGLLVGSEGALLIITRAALRVHPLPPFRALRGAEFPEVARAVDAMREMVRQGLAPTVLRLYDPVDTALSGNVRGADRLGSMEVEPGAIGCAGQERIRGVDNTGDLRGTLVRQRRAFGQRIELPAWERLAGETWRSAQRRLATLGFGAWPRLGGQVVRQLRRCRLVYGFEGSEAEVRAALTCARQIAAAAGGDDLGAAPGRHWLAHRYAVSYKMSTIADAGLWVDTFEVAVRWSRLLALYRAVREALQPHALCLAHFSHAYHDGCSIYFSFVGNGETADEAAASHLAAWRAGLEAARGVGAALSHHHGVGRLKAAQLDCAEGPVGRALRRALKRALDPDLVLNPGVLGLGGQAGRVEEAPAPGGDLEAADSGLRPLGGFALDASSGLLRAPISLRLGVLAARLIEVGLEIGGHPDSFGDLRLGTALAQRDPRILARLCALVSSYRGARWTTPLAPRSATGPDAKSFALGGGTEGLAVQQVWLAARPCPAPVRHRLTAAEPAALLRAGRELIDRGAAVVEIAIDDGRAALDVTHAGGELAAPVWRARIDDLVGQCRLQRLDAAPLSASAALATGRRSTCRSSYDVDEIALLTELVRWSSNHRDRARMALAPWGGLAVVIDRRAASTAPWPPPGQASGLATALASALRDGEELL
ncbi:MAG: FAD-binding oxidoreductase [Deltaproteobacteria bacterium]|nr:FAD-binding oxidoreductase [Deltaproteobacteria bacterium]